MQIRLNGFREFMEFTEKKDRKAPEDKDKDIDDEESIPDDIFGGMEDQFNIEPKDLVAAIKDVPIIKAWDKMGNDDVGLEPVLIKPGISGGTLERIPYKHDGSRVFRKGKRDWHPERHKGQRYWVPRDDDKDEKGMATLYAQGLPGWDGQPPQQPPGI